MRLKVSIKQKCFNQNQKKNIYFLKKQLEYQDMEKKGDFLNQLAIISDLLEKVNANTDSSTIVFGLSKEEFEKIFDLVQKKYNKKMEKPKDTFKISIGMIDIIFNMNNA